MSARASNSASWSTAHAMRESRSGPAIVLNSLRRNGFVFGRALAAIWRERGAAPTSVPVGGSIRLAASPEDAGAAPVRSTTSVPVFRSNIPAERDTFVGRESDLIQLSERLASARLVTVLGDGGVVAALRDASTKLGVTLEVRRHAELTGPISGAVVWTWPASVAPPASLRFDGATVAVIAYGQPALTIARHIGERGGTPLRLGPRWFVAQAREQRRLWETST